MNFERWLCYIWMLAIFIIFYLGSTYVIDIHTISFFFGVCIILTMYGLLPNFIQLRKGGETK